MIEARELACRRGGRLIFSDLAFRLKPGDALLLVGANGTGKTSLLRLLAGFARPAAGVIRWDGEDIAEDLAGHRTRVHFLGFADGLKGLLTAEENLAFLAALLGPGAEPLARALEGFGLAARAHRPARTLSAGQRRRLALARLAAAPRPLWLLDEPGVALDREGRARLEEAIERHRARGGIAVIATHGDVSVRDPLVLELGDRSAC
ncbi:MAG: heme ABC exporter ATP-binding protein CcmA [Geminicoccaceae bacterium]|nr:heme ABC exporter ATP-binding protein CcmA [Geminicoccaceae bacterium]MCS7266666.1 heme ABC exporter ATP-binding protein CcmA [Geminicoccaceae bacterium]MCX7630114.1 heme ABC exporter ATP-binding protein CcmA [Geminicoccaceae bacterium]MDW8123299.1 heme ABC exporter ATP-binding protein CcmA [Geminicoccaceae bacterium]MDW8340400.1 heme ABC exporter ATP-binding protein CcmA [Geminicoccaceae bacterium]